MFVPLEHILASSELYARSIHTSKRISSVDFLNSNIVTTRIEVHRWLKKCMSFFPSCLLGTNENIAMSRRKKRFQEVTSWRGKDDLDSLKRGDPSERAATARPNGQTFKGRNYVVSNHSYIDQKKHRFVRQEMVATLRVYAKRCVSEANPAESVEILFTYCDTSVFNVLVDSL